MIGFNFKSSLQQDDEFLQERDALEMEVIEPEARVELVSDSFKPSSRLSF